MYAWFGLAGSIEILDTARPGALAASVSSRVNVTALAGFASAFFEMKTRPVVVAAHSVELSLVVRLIQPMDPPLRLPRLDEVNEAPSRGCQSPHTTLKSPLNSLQCWSRKACPGPPSSCVRHT